MRPGNERAFQAGDPVATYWLHNCVGFDVRGLRGGLGVVHEVGADADGEPVLAIRRPVLGTTYVAASRVGKVDPWNETIVLRSRERAARPPSRSAEQAGRAGRAAASAGHAAALVTAAALGRFFSAVARLLLALAARLRAHAPGARRYLGSAATTLAAMGAAYAGEARRAYARQREAMNAWRESRRRDSWGDEAPLTRAGADEVDARDEERVGR
jgi:hypothetical protein